MAAGLARGAVSGAVGWWAMDGVLRFLYDREDPAVRRREDRARGGIPALEVMAERAAESVDLTLSNGARQSAGTALQWTAGAGMLYGVLRPRFPAVRAGRGVAFGAAFALVVDEGLVPLLGFAPEPTAFPWQTHARGFVGHLVFGAVADVTLDSPASRGSGDRRRSVIRPTAGS